VAETFAESRPYWAQVLAPLLEAMRPREAEARVVAKNPQAQTLVETLRSGATMPEGSPERNVLVTGRFDPLKRDIYQQILAAAEARPETVTVEHTPEGLEYVLQQIFTDPALRQRALQGVQKLWRLPRRLPRKSTGPPPKPPAVCAPTPPFACSSAREARGSATALGRLF